MTLLELLLKLSQHELELRKLSDEFRSAVIAEKEHGKRTQLAAALYNVNQSKLLLEEAAWHLQPERYQRPVSGRERVA